MSILLLLRLKVSARSSAHTCSSVRVDISTLCFSLTSFCSLAPPLRREAIHHRQHSGELPLSANHHRTTDLESIQSFNSHSLFQLKLYCHVLRSVTGKRNLLIIRLGLHQSFNTLGTPFYWALPTVITDTSMNSFLGAKSDLTRQPYSSVLARSVGVSGTCKRKRASDDYSSLPTSNSYPAIIKRQKYVYSARENTVKGSRGGCPRDGSISEEGSDEQSNDKKSSNEESSNEESSDEESSSEESSDKGSSGEEGRGSSWICSHVSQGLHAHDLATDKNFSLRTTSSLQIPTLNHPLNAPQSQLMKQCF